MNTTLTALPTIGATAQYATNTHRHANALVVDVVIIDHKTSYGRDLWLVRPVAGVGSVWVETYSLRNVTSEDYGYDDAQEADLAARRAAYTTLDRVIAKMEQRAAYTPMEN